MSKINPLIWDELSDIKTEDQIKKFVSDLLTYERKHMNQERVRGYSDFYDKSIEKHCKKKGSS